MLRATGHGFEDDLDDDDDDDDDDDNVDDLQESTSFG